MAPAKRPKEKAGVVSSPPSRPSGLAGNQSLAELACDEIRRAIRENRISAGSHLTEVALAESLNMSRTPVREAMRRLQSEGLLLNQPFRGAVVMRLHPEDVRQLYFVRMLLEPAAARLCAENASAAEIAGLKELLAREKASLGNASALIPLNRQLHQAILDGTHNQFLIRSIAAVHGLIPLMGGSNFTDGRYARRAHAQHRRMIAAISRRDTVEAEDVARLHVADSLAFRLDRLDDPKPDKAS